MSHSREPKNLTKGQIQNALSNTNSISGASIYLGVCYDTFSKYAKRYGLFEQNKNQQGRGIMKPRLNIPKKISIDYKDGIGERLYGKESWEGTMG